MLIYTGAGTFVAQICKQHKLAQGYLAEVPWLLLHNTGRIDRFAAQREAKDEAVKSYGKCRFERKARPKT